jgi:hypothetical protein
MICKCTESINCNPCTNVTRFSEMCAECIHHGHYNMQSRDVTGSNVAFKRKDQR